MRILEETKKMNPALAIPIEALLLVEKINRKYKPVWDQLGRTDQIALAEYFLPRNSRKSVLGPTRPRVVKWYCPFAAQDDFRIHGLFKLANHVRQEISQPISSERLAQLRENTSRSIETVKRF
jgi:hypothetical protein